jgi:hypothetical protein
MKRVLCLLLFLTACHPAEENAETVSFAAPGQLQLGGLTVAADGLLTSFVLPSGANLVTTPYRPFTLTRGRGAVHADRFPADSMVVLSQGPGRASIRLSAASLPEIWIDVELRMETNAVFFTVLDKVEPNLDWLLLPPELGLDTRFIPPLEFECQLGYIGWTPGSHTCSFAQGTIGAFCTTGNCENRTKHQSPAVTTNPLELGSLLGAALLPTPIKPLIGSGFALFTSAHPVKSFGFTEDFRTFKATFGADSDTGSALFLTSAPWVFGCPGPQFCPDSAQIAASLARDLGFAELQIGNGTWLQWVGPFQHASHGLFDPLANLREISSAVKSEGVCLVLHNLPSLLSQHNPLCGGDPNCPAALRGPNGDFIREDTYWFSDLNQRSIQDAIVESTANGLVDSGVCGMYADGMDWFYAHPFSSSTWIEEFYERVPQLKLLPNYTLGNAALFTQETEIQDVWQIYRHYSTRDWAIQFGYFALQGMLEDIGIRPRLGWIPSPRPTDGEQDYQMILNSAVATGSFVTIETGGDDPTLTGAQSPWFRPALQETLASVDEIRAGRAHGFFAGGTARYELHHFDSGVSTVVLFDSIVPAGQNTQLEARGFGVQTRSNGECGPFNECFYFTGAPRMLHGLDQAPLSERGSYLYHPGHPGTDSESFTVTAWFKPEAHRPAVGGIFEKGMLGYGMSYYQGSFTGHFSGPGPGEVFGILQPIGSQSRPDWHHAAFSYNDVDSTFRLYVDGVKQQEVPSALKGNFYASTPIYVGTGGTPYDGANFSGWINDVRLYGRTVSDAEVEQIYQSAFGSKDPTLTDPPVLAWSAGQVAVGPVMVDVDLESQRTAYLVPMLEGTALPSETVRLTFRDVQNPQRAQVQAPFPVIVRRNRLARTVVVEVDSAQLGFKPARIAVLD